MSLLTGRRYALDSRAARDPHARLLGPLACTGYHLAKPLRVLVSKHENRLRKRRPACWVLPAMKFGLWGLQSSRGGATPLKTPEGPAVPPQHEGWLRSVVSAVAGVLVFAAGIALTVVAAKANPSVMFKLLSAEVGVFSTIIATLITIFFHSKASMDNIKERIDTLQNLIVQQRAADREEMIKQRAADREEMNKQRAVDRDEMKDLINNGVTEMVKQRAADREEMNKQRAVDRDEMKDLINNGVTEMVKQRAKDMEEMIKQRAADTEEMIKQRAKDMEEMNKQRAVDREEMKDLINNGIYRLENQIVQLKEAVIVQRP